MRITSGTAKGRTIQVPENIRPTQDKVRQAVFSMLYDLVGNTRVLDLFAGSGAYGLEALSRGAGSVIFVDSNKRCTEIIKESLKKMRLENRATVITAKTQAFVERYSSEHSLESVAPNPKFKCQMSNQIQSSKFKSFGFWVLNLIWHLDFGFCNLHRQTLKQNQNSKPNQTKNNGKFGLVFLDPPYSSGPRIHLLKSLAKILTPEGLIIFEHAKETKIPKEVGSLKLLRQRTYSATTVSLLTLANGKQS